MKYLIKWKGDILFQSPISFYVRDFNLFVLHKDFKYNN